MCFLVKRSTSLIKTLRKFPNKVTGYVDSYDSIIRKVVSIGGDVIWTEWMNSRAKHLMKIVSHYTRPQIIL